jgi:hypothetical protein
MIIKASLEKRTTVGNETPVISWPRPWLMLAVDFGVFFVVASSPVLSVRFKLPLPLRPINNSEKPAAFSPYSITTVHASTSTASFVKGVKRRTIAVLLSCCVVD